MILYPTETIYALGANALDDAAIESLNFLKGRGEEKFLSWLVRDIEDIAQYGELSSKAAEIASQFLPGPLTLVLPAKENIPPDLRGPDNTVSFRISPDPIAQQVIAEFMEQHNAPLTCTSANVSGLATEQTPEAILKQFGDKASLIDKVVDDGPRSGQPSTVIKVVDDDIEIIREGAISAHAILGLSH
ncbi:MAG: L-threonylcarbamoyladenylate synthase [Patescibacteria group bacterium]